MITLLSRSTPKARKPHICVWCGELIQIGEAHVHQVVKHCGDLQDSRWHLECHNASSDYFNNGAEDEFTPESFRRGTCDER